MEFGIEFIFDEEESCGYPWRPLEDDGCSSTLFSCRYPLRPLENKDVASPLEEEPGQAECGPLENGDGSSTLFIFDEEESCRYPLRPLEIFDLSIVKTEPLARIPISNDPNRIPIYCILFSDSECSTEPEDISSDESEPEEQQEVKVSFKLSSFLVIRK